MNKDDILLGDIKDVIHEALNRAAEDYIYEAVEKFEDDLRKRKNEIIIAILNEMEMTVMDNPMNLSKDIRIVFNVKEK